MFMKFHSKFLGNSDVIRKPPLGESLCESQAMTPVCVWMRRVRNSVVRVGLGIALVPLLLAVGCRTARGPGLDVSVPTSGTLFVGDVLKVYFPGTPDMAQSQKIRPDGRISLPMIGEVEVVGKKLGEIQGELSRRYKPLLQSSEVIVTQESTANAVYVTGAVVKPGKVVLDRPLTALEAIMEVGGFAPEEAITRRVTVIRNVKGRQMTQVLNMSPALKGKPIEAFYLRPYDMIYVPGGGY
jgi:polysaccharide biosynthesis/export protein